MKYKSFKDELESRLVDVLGMNKPKVNWEHVYQVFLGCMSEKDAKQAIKYLQEVEEDLRKTG